MKELKETFGVVTEFVEKKDTWRNWFYFKIDEVKYQLFFVSDESRNLLKIEAIYHEEYVCPFCTKGLIRTETCDKLYEKRKELFQLLIKHSKNRLRWVNTETN